MPKKQVKKRTVAKVVAKASKRSHRQILKEHSHFLAVLVLFVGFSAYAMVSFFGSTNNFINGLYADVLGPPTLTVYEEEMFSQDNPFSDLSSAHVNADAIVALYYEGVVSGYGDGTYKPDNRVSRAEFSKMLVEASDLDYAEFDAAVLANCFSDVADLPDHWFAPSVCAAKYQGWVSGYDNGRFSPSQEITRAEAAKIVLMAFGFEVPANESVTAAPYVDVPMEGAWYLGVAQAAKDNAIFGQDNMFNAGAAVTRAGIAQMIYNAMVAKGLL